MLEQRKLLILGLLSKADMHGYMLNEHLGMNIPITLKKPTAYNILEKLEQEQLISSKEETTGERKRKVFSLTASGRNEYIRLLREQLSAFLPGEYPNMVSLSFLDDIPNSEALSLLRKRLEKIEQFVRQFSSHDLETDSGHSDSSFLPFEFARRVIQMEKNFIEEIIQKMEE